MEIKIPIELPDDWADQVIERLKEDGTLVAVVRCKDCKYLGIKDFVYGYCKKNVCGIIQPDDYCSQGEREDLNGQN